MSCDDFIPLLVREAEGRLDEGRRTELLAHLHRCSSCREALAAQREVASALRSRPDAQPSERFAARVAAAIGQQASWVTLADWRWLSMRVVPVAAALLLAAGILVERGQQQPAQQNSLSAVVETWAAGDAEQVPAPAVLWEPDVSDESLLLTVLSSQPDAAIGRSQ